MNFLPREGGCACGAVRYSLRREPMFVHCCHCRWCQRETGAAFALNALIEADQVAVLTGMPRVIDTPSNSGRGQRISRCPNCQVALWSNYGAAGAAVHFLRVGTLDDAQGIVPDIHIYTESRQSWLTLNRRTPAVGQYYTREDYWPRASIARYRRATGTEASKPA